MTEQHCPYCGARFQSQRCPDDAKAMLAGHITYRHQKEQ